MPLYDSSQEVHVVDQLADLFGVTADQPVGDFYQMVKLLLRALLPFVSLLLPFVSLLLPFVGLLLPFVGLLLPFGDPIQDALDAVEAVAG